MFEREADPRLQGLDQASIAFSMLSAHEFAIEVLLANLFAALNAEQAASVGEDMAHRWDRAYSATLTTDPSQIADTARQLDAAQALTERLTRKALRRADELRGRRQRPANDTA